MKKNFLIMLASFFIISLTACNSSDKDSDRDIQLIEDPASYDNDATTDQPELNNNEPEQNANEVTNNKKVTPSSSAPRPASSSNNNKTTAPVNNIPTEVETPQPDTTNTVLTSSQPVPEATGDGAGSEAAPEKKGISGTAKGAIIGGAAGAVGGAIISKKKGVGAAIGGAVGAAAGAIIGNKSSKKNDTTENRK